MKKAAHIGVSLNDESDANDGQFRGAAGRR